MPDVYQIDHVLSTKLLRSAIFDDITRRVADAAPEGIRVTRSTRPDKTARVHHYHRPNLERRLLPRSVVTVHHDLRESEAWLNVKSFLRRYREAHAVHCLNNTQAAYLHAQGIAATEVIPHGVDRTVFPVPNAARHPRTEGRLILGIASRRYARGVKGEALLEQLIAHLDPARVGFVLLGEDRWRTADLLRRHGFSTDTFERLPYRLFGQAYGGIDALLILSDFEGGPASLPEALGAGIPVFSTPVGRAPDDIRDGVNGLLLSRHPATDGARLMALLDTEAQGLRQLLAGAFTGAVQIPSWDDVLARYFTLYQRVAEA